MRINPRRFVRAAVLIIILAMALAVLIGYAAIRLTGHSIVKDSVIKAKDDKIAEHEKIYDIQGKIKKDFLFDYDESSGMDAMSKGLVESLNDDYSEYMTSEELKEWEEAVNSSFTGIGITFNVTDGRAEVTSVADDGPADAAQIEAGDIIRTVDGREFETEKEFIRLISGKPGKTLKLDMLRGWYTFEADVTIGEVKMRVCQGKVVSKNIGYIRLTSFSMNSAEEFAAELKALTAKQIKGLVIDLRGNGGGYVDQGIKICDQLLPECTIGYVEDKNGKREAFNSDEESLDLPIAVLVNEKSASCSEIVAAAIKDNKAGTIVGMKTYGKGVSQTEYKFSDGSALKLTTSRFISPSGQPIDGKGVTPNKQVKASTSEENGDKQLKAAVRILK